MHLLLLSNIRPDTQCYEGTPEEGGATLTTISNPLLRVHLSRSLVGERVCDSRARDLLEHVDGLVDHGLQHFLRGANPRHHAADLAAEMHVQVWPIGFSDCCLDAPADQALCSHGQCLEAGRLP